MIATLMMREMMSVIEQNVCATCDNVCVLQSEWYAAGAPEGKFERTETSEENATTDA